LRSSSGRFRNAQNSPEVGLDPDQRRGEADRGTVVARELVSAHRDPTPLLEPVEAPFDDIASFVADSLLVAEIDGSARLLPAVGDLVVALGDRRGDPALTQPARVVASLTRRFGDLDVAEEATAEAFAIAVERWPADGVPPNPGAWLTTTANHKAIDRIRRENKRGDKQEEAHMLYDDEVELATAMRR
jgi:hypothetical protein